MGKMIMPKTEGGLGLRDLRLIAQIATIKRRLGFGQRLQQFGRLDEMSLLEEQNT